MRTGLGWRLWFCVLLLAFYAALSTGRYSSLLLWFERLAPIPVVSSRQATQPNAAPFSRDLIPNQFLGHIEDAIAGSLIRQIGRQDFALALDGARIADGLTTTHGTPLIHVPHPATVVLRDNMHGGRCWLIPGARGQVGIILPEPVRLSHVTVDHIPLQIAEAIGRDARQAPRSIIVWAKLEDEEARSQYSRFLAERDEPTRLPEGGPHLSEDDEFVALAHFQYDIHASQPVQTFPVHEELGALQMRFNHVVFEFMDNWGADCTCIYHVRVHGEAGSIGNGVAVSSYSSHDIFCLKLSARTFGDLVNGGRHVANLLLW